MQNTIQNPKNQKRPFGKRDIIGYFFGDFGCNMSFSLQAAWLFIFYTQYIGIELGHWAIIILITKIFDGINDPIAGFIIDKLGANDDGEKFKPWIKYGGPILAFVPILMFIDSSGWTYGLRLVICFITYLAWDLAYTVVNVPYGALSSVMTTDPVERTQLSTARSYGGQIGAVALAYFIPKFVYSYDLINGENVNIFIGQNMVYIAFVLGFISLVSFAILYFNVEERVEPQLEKEGETENVGVVQTVKSLAKNRAFWGLFAATVGQILFIMGSTNQLYQLTLQMHYNDGSLGSYLTLVTLAPMIFGGIFGTKVVKRFGKKEASAYPLLISSAIMLSMYFLPIENPYVYLAMITLANTFSFGIVLYLWAMVSDVIDYQEYLTGNRNEGSVYALYSMGRKILQGFSSSFVPFMITIVAPTLATNNPVTWTPGNTTAISNLSIGFALTGYLIAFVSLAYIYNLDEEKVSEVNNELKEKHAANERLKNNLEAEDAALDTVNI